MVLEHNLKNMDQTKKQKKIGCLTQSHTKELFLVPIFCVDFVLDPFSFGILCFDTRLHFVHVLIFEFKRWQKNH